jgi:hypothetical protein
MGLRARVCIFLERAAQRGIQDWRFQISDQCRPVARNPRLLIPDFRQMPRPPDARAEFKIADLGFQINAGSWRGI